MSRALAHVEVIGSVSPIEGKDKIVLAEILGWKVIVQKEFKVGDKVVFVEIDSVLPEKPEFEFLRSRKFRIKTMKMAGVISQGIVFSMDFLPQGEYQIGENVTEILGVTQYEATMDKDDEDANESGFPNFISKTDEKRVQADPSYLKMDCKWIATEKVDGTSASFTLQRTENENREYLYDYAVCSRGRRLFAKDNSVYWKVAEKYNIEEALYKLISDNTWVAVQGECIAPGVQKNKYNVKFPDFYAFNLIYPSGRVGSVEAKKILENVGIKFVPVICDDAPIKGMTVSEVLEYADGKSQIYDTLREGIVFRSENGTQSFKAVSPKFLMKYDE